MLNLRSEHLYWFLEAGFTAVLKSTCVKYSSVENICQWKSLYGDLIFPGKNHTDNVWEMLISWALSTAAKRNNAFISCYDKMFVRLGQDHCFS